MMSVERLNEFQQIKAFFATNVQSSRFSVTTFILAP